MKARVLQAQLARHWPWLLIGLGILLRTVQYLSGRSLWGDEGALALNIVNRSYGALLQPLDHKQVAPVLFLWASRAAVDLLGPGEDALRLPAFVCGVLSVPLFYLLARRWSDTSSAAFATALFAISEHLVAYSDELKQYSTDVFFALLIFWLSGAGQPRLQRWWLVGLVGMVAVWASHASALMLAGVCLVQGIATLQERRWRDLAAVIGCGVMWASSFVVMYFMTLTSATRSSYLMDYWQGTFAPIPPKSLGELRWFVDTPFKLLAMPGGFPYPGVAALPLLVGILATYRASPHKCWLTLSGVLVALLASSVGKYPFGGRLMLFAVPFGLLFIGEGAALMVRDARSLKGGVGPLLLLLLFVPTGIIAARDLIHPRTKEEVRPVVQEMLAQWRAGEPIYVYYGARYPFRYYADRMGLQPDQYTIGGEFRKDWERYRDDLKALLGEPRAWIVFAHPCTWEGVDEEVLFRRYLDQLGRKRAEFTHPGATVFLYDFTRPGKGAPEDSGPDPPATSAKSDR
ncbi:MAG: glycosyltransferase family 39 protein [Acidobacteriota bacterium]|nr:glycosyltransferase family 39 protein [Acidobacteriota bacterium]